MRNGSCGSAVRWFLFLTVSMFAGLLLFPAVPAGAVTTGADTVASKSLAAASPAAALQVPSASEKTDAIKTRIAKMLPAMPMAFIPNQGQVDEKVKFYTLGRGTSLSFTPGGVDYSFVRSAGATAGQKAPHEMTTAAPEKTETYTLRQEIIGADLAGEIAGVDRLPGVVNYFRGKDRSQWRTNVPTYSQIAYRNIYPGIDLAFKGTGETLEYDFVIRPGADPKGIALAYRGAESLAVSGDGDLIIGTPWGVMREKKPHVFQMVDGAKREVEGRFVIAAADGGVRRYGFTVGAYDTTLPLVIDPALIYSGLIGGGGSDSGNDVAVDGSGNAYLVGRTTSTNFPFTPTAYQKDYGNGDAFVMKVSSDGTSVPYVTYLGGLDNADIGYGIAVNSAGEAWVTGVTYSTNFPLVSPLLPYSFGGSRDAFVAHLNADGSDLLFSTYLGGDNMDEGKSITLDSAGAAYVTGYSTCNTTLNFPTTPLAYQQTCADMGFKNAFVTKINASHDLVYSTLIGGSLHDEATRIAVSGDTPFITGFAISDDYPVVGTLNGADQSPVLDGPVLASAFVTQIDSTGSELSFSTYLGSDSGHDFGMGIDVNPSGTMIYVTGYTGTSGFPTTAGAYQTDGQAGENAFLTRYTKSTGWYMTYSSYLGGSGDDYGMDVAYDPSTGMADAPLVTGYTTSTDFPMHTDDLAGTQDAFFARFATTNTGVNSLLGAGYFGGTGWEYAVSLMIDSSGDMLATGMTNSWDLPDLHTPVFGPVGPLGGLSDAFLAKWTPARIGYYCDADGDGYYCKGQDGSVESPFEITDPLVPLTCSNRRAYAGDDCDDTVAGIHPGATEVCNGIDDNCDGQIDEDFDNDGDGYTTCGGDCNDNDFAVHPGATEVCNGIDDNCDGQTDEGVKSTFYLDADGDGYGNPSITTQACSAPAGYVANSTDCNDSNSAISPGATEVCDGVDNDCDGFVDEGFDADGDLVAYCFDNCPTLSNPGQEDSDGDGIGDVCDATNELFDSDLPWTVIYSGDALPQDSTPAWTRSGDGSFSEEIVGGALHIATIPNRPVLLQYSIANPTLSNITGTTAEVRLRNTGIGSGFSAYLWINDGTLSARLSIGAVGLSLNSTPAQTFAMDTTSFHVYRLTLLGSVVQVYVDGNLKMSGTVTTSNSTRVVPFGHFIASSDQTQEAFWDYVKFHTGGASAIGDGTPDATDNCPDVYNPTQTDTDSDGIGDACDNCRDYPNSGQEDGDNDGVGDTCDLDKDNDGLTDYEEGVFGTNPLSADTDGDGTDDLNDAFPLDPAETRDSDSQQLVVSATGSHPDISRKHIVWQNQTSGGGVSVYDLTTGSVTLISNIPGTGTGSPAISGNRVVYGRTLIGQGGSGWPLYMYDISTGTETRITGSAARYGGVNPPDISGDIIVWEDGRHQLPYREIYMYNISTGQESLIGRGDAPNINADRIVYLSNETGSYAYFAYDIPSGTKLKLSNGVGTGHPDISGNSVVWSEVRSNNGDIYLYNLSTNTERRITNTSPYETDPSISGNKIVWNAGEATGYRIDMFDLSNSQRIQLTNNNASASSPAVFGGRAVWRQSTGMIVYAGDGVGDNSDNCPGVYNPTQVDSDGDGIGDACDTCTDADLDGYGSVGFDLSGCSGSTMLADCNDADAAINPGAADVCNDTDDNCNGQVDEDLTRPTICGLGVCSDNTGLETCAAGVWGGNTCNPLAGATAEVCADGLDNNCNGLSDEGCSGADADGDGYPSSCGLLWNCQVDCNDAYADIHPGATEICDGADNDCDGVADEGFADADGDGIGDACDDDADNDGIPNAGDNCPLVYNLDQGDVDTDLVGNLCDPDADGDGYPAICDPLETSCHADCDDADPAIYYDPGTGTCDGLPTGTAPPKGTTAPDGDGDGKADTSDNCPSVANADQANVDGDSLGNACDSCPNDAANDADADGVCAGSGTFLTPKIGVNDNCSSVANANQANLDGDAFGNACDTDADGDGYAASGNPADCNDLFAAIRPQGTEIFNNGIDDDCDASTSDNPSGDIVFAMTGYDTWLPGDGNTATVSVTVSASGAQSIGPVTLSWISSSHPGKYTNDASTDTSDDITVGGLVSGSTITNGGSAVLTSHDYGASILMTATANVLLADGVTTVTLRKDWRLPKNSDAGPTDNLPDAWESQHGDLTDTGDIDTSGGNTSNWDGQSNFQEYRGYFWGGFALYNNGTADAVYQTKAYLPSGALTHLRTDPKKKDLFVKHAGYGTGDYAFAVGNAFREAGIEVHAADAAQAASAGTANIDVLTVTLEPTALYSLYEDGHTNKRAVRDFLWDTLGESAYGSATAFGAGTSLYKKALDGYFNDKTYMEKAISGGVTTGLDALTVVEDKNDNGVLDTKSKEDIVANGVLDGDYYVTNSYSLANTVFDVNNDGLYELPLVASTAAAASSTSKFSRAQIVKHVTTHEIGHAVGMRHNTVSTCLMYEYSTNWSRDTAFSTQAKSEMVFPQ